jgi:hypothetical protein
MERIILWTITLSWPFVFGYLSHLVVSGAITL